MPGRSSTALDARADFAIRIEEIEHLVANPLQAPEWLFPETSGDLSNDATLCRAVTLKFREGRM